MPKAMYPVLLVADGSRLDTAAVIDGGSMCVEVDAIGPLTSAGAGNVLEDPSMHSKVKVLDSD